MYDGMLNNRKEWKAKQEEYEAKQAILEAQSGQSGGYIALLLCSLDSILSAVKVTQMILSTYFIFYSCNVQGQRRAQCARARFGGRSLQDTSQPHSLAAGRGSASLTSEQLWKDSLHSQHIRALEKSQRDYLAVMQKSSWTCWLQTHVGTLWTQQSSFFLQLKGSCH